MISGCCLRGPRRSDNVVRSDRLCLIQAIIAGVSFLGAGTIFVSRKQRQPVGLTTAGSIWVTAAVGVALGLEHPVLAVDCTPLVPVILGVLPLLGIDVDE